MSAPAVHFQDMTVADAVAMHDVLTRLSPSRTCDFSVGGMLMWAGWFGYQRHLTDNCLYVRGRAEGAQAITAYSLPVCRDVPGAIRTLVAHSRRNGMRPAFTAVPEEWVDIVATTIGGHVQVTELIDWADYLYDVDDLAGLRGKRFNKKRNHVNRFIADNPHYVAEDLTDDLLPEVILFCTGRRHQVAEDGNDPMALYELSECLRVLADWQVYGMEGVVLRDETGAICAFAAAEVIGDTAFVHIEKCDHRVSGANEAIASMTAKRLGDLHPRLRYLNREEDMGDPGLRAAKESWHPVSKLRKFNIIL